MNQSDIQKHITRSRKALDSAKFLVSKEFNEDAEDMIHDTERFMKRIETYFTGNGIELP